MNKFSGILICTDLDGTLLRNDKSISSENLEAIEYFKSEGGLFTFTTGRMPFYIQSMVEAVKPSAPVGCANGGGIYDFGAGRYLWNHPLSESVIELVEYVEERIPGIGIHVNGFDKAWFCKDNQAMVSFRNITGLPNLIEDYRNIHVPMCKVLFSDTDTGSLSEVDRLLRSHPRAGEFEFVNSEASLYEILPGGINKGVSVKKLMEILGIEREKTIAVGDYYNDIPMLEAAGLGIAVSNACDEAKRVADMITVSNEEHAIHRIISELDCGKLKI